MDFHNDWAILEADFRREYNIDLVRERHLSWRSFLVLAQGLSKNSVWVLTYQGRESGEVAITDTEAGERAMDNLW